MLQRLESCTVSGVKFLYTSKLVTGDQNFGCMRVGPCGFTASFQLSSTFLSISHLVAAYPWQQFLCKSCGVRAALDVFGISHCIESVSAVLKSSGYPKSALNGMVITRHKKILGSVLEMDDFGLN